MRQLTILFLFISSMGLCQFSPIWNINNNFSQFEMRAFDVNDSGEMLLLTDQYNGGPTSNIMAYSSLDYGQTWDSTLFTDFYAMRDNAVITDGGFMYFASIQNVFPPSSPSYQRRVIHSSLDGGNSWEIKTIDSVFGANFERSISFLNDSTGMFFYNGGKYLTQDYGNSWQKISSSGAEHLGVLDDRFIFYWYQSAVVVNPFTNQVDSISYEPYCEGNVDHSFFYDSVSYRMMFGQNGQNMGPQYNGNYAGFNIDELPLGNQRSIHFPQDPYLVDIDVTESCIHIVISGRYARSCDGGDTFHFVDAFAGNINEQVISCEFVNDTLGYLLSQNLITYEWHLWETTNGGGQNLEQVLTHQSAAGVEVIESEFNFTVYPNPTSDQITVESKETILSIELYSLDGKMVLHKEPNSNTIQFDISSLTDGTYFVKILGSASSKSVKISKQ